MQLAMSSTKMKSLLKGLRYISQVFESEKEEEMQIGNPTDVKHVAHIGWDGPSDNATAPSWMNEFKNSPVLESIQGNDSSVKCQSEYGGRSRDLPNLPKSTRKSSSEKGSPTKDKSKRRSSNRGTSSSRRSKESLGQDEDSSLSQHSGGLPDIPKKSKRKKSKEGGGSSSRSSRRSEADRMSDFMSDTGSIRSMSQIDDDKDGF